MSPTTLKMSLTVLDSSQSIEGAFVSVDVSGVNWLTAQCSIVDGTAYGSGVVKIEGTIDGLTTWFTLATFSADSISSALDVTQYAIVRARVSTVGTGVVAVSLLPKKI